MAKNNIPPQKSTNKSKNSLRKAYPDLDELHSKLLYNPCTGLFIWKKRPETNIHNINHNKTIAGKIAGSAHPNGYIHIRMGENGYAAHRLAWIWWYGENPNQEIDHRNRNRSDNRIINLRPVSLTEQARNKNIYKNNKSGFRGVSYHKSSSKWRAAIGVNGKKKHIGYFDTVEEANAAYLELRLKIWKDL